MSSAAEFVDGGVQDPCDDACSICLEDFCAQDPASITGCNHAYHLQCILEWVQRSSECPMCWQPLVMKDVVGQELLASTVQDRSLRANQIHASFLPQLRSEDYELDQFASFEERLMRHLAAASARQVHGQWRKNRFHFRPASNEYPGQFIYLPNQTSAASAGFGTLDASDSGLEEQPANGSGHSTFAVGATRPRHCNVTHSHSPSAGSFAQGASTSEVQSFSEAIKSRLTAASSKYKETFSKTAKLFREKMRARTVTHSDSGVRSQDLSTGVVQALGQISLESAGERRNRDEAPTYISLKQACILDKKQSETLSTNFTHNNLDAGKSKFQDVCRNSSQPTSVGIAGSSEDIDLKLTSLGGEESLVEDKQAITIA